MGFMSISNDYSAVAESRVEIARHLAKDCKPAAKKQREKHQCVNREFGRAFRFRPGLREARRCEGENQLESSERRTGNGLGNSASHNLAPASMWELAPAVQ